MKVNERYLNGAARMELPLLGVSENDPKLNQAANLGMWAELSIVPAALLADRRVGWEPVDDSTALLVVPFEGSRERFVVRFDPATGLVRTMEAMRYQGVSSPAKSLWVTEALAWRPLAGFLTSTRGSATWFEQGRPWAVFTTEDVVYNADIRDDIRRRGP